jgi:hypothetical protein
MQIDKSDEQHENAYPPIDKRLESDSNVTVERDVHRQKDRLPSVSREEGMQIAESDEHLKNADSSIDESFEPDSNAIVKRDVALSKQWSPSMSTDEGMQILTETAMLPFSVTQHLRSTTSRRTPPTETQFRGKTHPVDLEQAQNAFLPSDLYPRLSSSIESAQQDSPAATWLAETASDRAS